MWVSVNNTSSFLEEKKELYVCRKQIGHLIESFNKNKDGTINWTFQGVTKHFTCVFNELVPNSSGKLLISTEYPLAENTGSGKDSQQATNSPRVSLYWGVEVKSNAQWLKKKHMMSQLSGGQKVLVVMGLVPFNLFGELNKALFDRSVIFFCSHQRWWCWWWLLG